MPAAPEPVRGADARHDVRRPRIVVAIPHYWSGRADTVGARRDRADQRAGMLARVVTTLHETFGGTRRVSPGYDVPWGPERDVEVLVVTTDDGAHLLDSLAPIAPLFTHVPLSLETPRALPFACRAVLAERIGDFDEFACLEDDIVVADPWFFDKLAWFRRHAATDAVLMANRFERRDGLKAYIDPVLSAAETAAFQDLTDADEVRAAWPGVGEVVFRQVDNPHASCWFVSRDQMAAWTRVPGFDRVRTDFVAEIESGMCPAVGGPFRLYKAVPPRPDFLEVEHASVVYLDWGIPEGTPAAKVVADRALTHERDEARRAAIEAEQARATAEAAHAALLRSPTFRLTAPLRRLVRWVRPRRP